jgi:rhodanese-related sulfurtransferase
MTNARFALLVTPALLALVACGGEPGEAERGGDRSSSAPFGFELAIAGTAGLDDGSAAPAAPAPVPAPVIDVTPEELAARLAKGNVRLIDVRTDAEVAEGTIPGAEHIPLDRFEPATLDLSDGREVVLYCRSGRRSAMASEKLAAAIGAPVEHLAGGVLAWEAAGQPLEKR